MFETKVTVAPAEGLHARPASIFVQEAKRYTSDIWTVKGDKIANAKSSLTVMALGAKQGETLTIRADGEDETAAVEALAAVISEAPDSEPTVSETV